MRMGVYNLGELIRCTRLAQGLSQMELARDICTPETLSRIERRKRSPLRRVYEMLMERLGLSPSLYYTYIPDNLELQRLLKELSKLFFLHEEKNSQEYLNKLKPYLKEGNYQTRQYIITEETLSLYYGKQISADAAIEKLKQTYQITKKTMPVKIENTVLSQCETKILVNLALLYKDKGKIEECVEQLLFLKEYYEGSEYNIIRNKATIIWANLANIYYFTLKDYDKCIEISLEGLQIERKYQSGILVGRYCFYLAACENKKGKETACCIEKMQQAYWISKSIGDKITMCMIEQFLASLF